MSYKCIDTWDLSADWWAIAGQASSANGILKLDGTKGKSFIRPLRQRLLWENYDYSSKYSCFKFTLALTAGGEFEVGLNLGLLSGVFARMAKFFSFKSVGSSLVLDTSGEDSNNFNGSSSFSASDTIEVRVAYALTGAGNTMNYASSSDLMLKVSATVGSTTYSSSWATLQDMLNEPYSTSNSTIARGGGGTCPVFSCANGSATLSSIEGYARCTSSEAANFVDFGTVPASCPGKCSPVDITVTYVGTNHIAKVVMSSSTPNVTIRYSVDGGFYGDNPLRDPFHEMYTEPLFFDRSVKIRAIALSNGYLNSEPTVTDVMMETTVLPRPEVSPYSESITITSNSELQPGIDVKTYLADKASIARYTLDGSTPTASSPVLGEHFWLKYDPDQPAKVLKVAAFKGAVMSSVTTKRFVLYANSVLVDATDSSQWSVQGNATFSASGMTVNDPSNLGVKLKSGLLTKDWYRVTFTTSGDFILGVPGSKRQIRAIAGKVGFYDVDAGSFISVEDQNWNTATSITLTYPATISYCSFLNIGYIMFGSKRLGARWYDTSDKKTVSSSLLCFSGSTSYTISNVSIIENLWDNSYTSTMSIAAKPAATPPSGYYTSNQSPTLTSSEGTAGYSSDYSVSSGFGFSPSYNGYIPLESNYPTYGMISTKLTGKVSSPPIPMKYFTHPDSRAWVTTKEGFIFESEREHESSWMVTTSYLYPFAGSQGHSSGKSAFYSEGYNWSSKFLDAGDFKNPWMNDLQRYKGPELVGATNIWYTGVVAVSEPVDFALGLGFDVGNNEWIGLCKIVNNCGVVGSLDAAESNGILNVCSLSRNNDAVNKEHVVVTPMGDSQRSIRWSAARKGPVSATQTRVQFFRHIDGALIYDSGWSSPMNLTVEAMPALLMKAKYTLQDSNGSRCNVVYMMGYKNLTDAEMDRLLTKFSLNPPEAPVITPTNNVSWSQSVSVTVTGLGARLLVNCEDAPFVSADEYSGSLPYFNYVPYSPQAYAGNYSTYNYGRDENASLSYTGSFYAPVKLRAVVEKSFDSLFKPKNVAPLLSISPVTVWNQKPSVLDVVDVLSVKPGVVTIAPKLTASIFTNKREFQVATDDGLKMFMRIPGGPVFLRVKPGNRTIKVSVVSHSKAQGNFYTRTMRDLGEFADISVSVPQSGTMTVTAPSTTTVGAAVALSCVASGGTGIWSSKIFVDGTTYEGSNASVAFTRVGVFNAVFESTDEVGNYLKETVKIAVKSTNKIPTNIIGQTPEQFT